MLRIEVEDNWHRWRDMRDISRVREVNLNKKDKKSKESNTMGEKAGDTWQNDPNSYVQPRIEYSLVGFGR